LIYINHLGEKMKSIDTNCTEKSEINTDKAEKSQVKSLDSLIEILNADDLRNVVGGEMRPKGVE